MLLNCTPKMSEMVNFLMYSLPQWKNIYNPVKLNLSFSSFKVTF